jgi:hypothetical protein
MSQHSEIQNQLNRYTCAVNRRDWDELAAVFTEQGVWECKGPPDLKFAGRAALIEGLKASIGATKMLVQMNTPAMIAVQGTRATARSTMLEVATFPDQNLRCEIFGMYEDKIVQTGGVWQFEIRSFTIIELRNLKIDAGI